MRPFLKWAGGKYALLHNIKELLPCGKRLIEPFVGAGSVFLNTNFSSYLLSDANTDLINLYQQLQKHGDSFISYCEQFFLPEYNNAEQFYQLREQFNKSKSKKLRSALFLYLNKHGYNGLCRYNSSGKFNVPFGQMQSPKCPKKQMIHFYEKSKSITFSNNDFVETMRSAKKGDVVYCDPPYVPLTKTSHFTRYSPLDFKESHQIQLGKEAERLANTGVPVLISNHDTEFTREIYSKARITSFEVNRYISCNSNNRNKAKELIAVFD